MSSAAASARSTPSAARSSAGVAAQNASGDQPNITPATPASLSAALRAAGVDAVVHDYDAYLLEVRRAGRPSADLDARYRRAQQQLATPGQAVLAVLAGAGALR